jgi:DNA gyrase subunit A
MDEITKDKNEKEIIMPGQICYDELDPIEEEQEIQIDNEINGQISLMELDTNGNNKLKGRNKLDNRVDEEERNKRIIEESQEEEENIIDEIESDRASRKSASKKSNQIKFDLDSCEDKIILNPLEEVLHNSMIPYTEHVVLDRALPRVEDGLKPVQRRILYTMLELGLEPDKPFRKSARIVGDCMGKYHPHGDSSVYDAMVRMSQNFSLREPLVLGHGNFGSIDGDSAAAMRYTEARLTPLAMELLRDLEKNTVRWNLNFDDTLKEPAMLPGRFPNLLVNGASGIAVGVATNIPPHNLTEVIDGVIAYINNPKITLEEMMKIIKGPDFPTGGLIYCNELEQAYRTGKGRIIIRAKIHLEEKADRKFLVITEVPYQTNKANLLQKIAELRDANKGILSGIIEIRDESDRNGMRAVIRLKKEANEKAILDFLYKQTGLETTFGINIVAIAGGKPRQLGLLEIISYYAEYQREIIYRRTKYDLDQAKDRAHILEGLLIAIKNIDEVIKIIKSSASVSDARLKLRSKFNLSEKQAQAILDMRLARLVNLEVNKLIDELKDLKEKIAQLTKIYESKRLQLEVVKTELAEIKRKYKSNRKSTIEKGELIKETSKKVKKEEPVIENDVILAITADKTVKSIGIKNYNLSQKDVNENTTLSHVHTQLLNVKNTKKVLIFTDKGNCYKILADKIPELKWRDKGVQLKAIDKKISSEDNPIKIIELPEDLEKKELIFFTSKGMVKRSALSEYDIAKAYFQAIKLKEGDQVINVEIYEEKGSILLVSKGNMVLNFEKTDIPVQGRVSSGVKGINIDDEDSVIFGTQITKSGNLTLLTDKGYAKRVAVAEFGLSARYRKGLRAISLVDKAKEIVYANFESEDDVIAVNLGDKIKLVKKIEIESRLSEGKKRVSGKIISASDYCLI